MPEQYAIFVYDDPQIVRLLQLHGIISFAEDCSNGRVRFRVSHEVSWTEADHIFDIVFGNTLRYCPQPLVTIGCIN